MRYQLNIPLIIIFGDKIMKPWLRFFIALILLISFLAPTVRTLSRPLAVPDLTYTTGTTRLINANWGNTSPTSFVVNFQTTMSTASLNASLGIMGINYNIKNSQWGWRMSIASVLQSSLTVLMSVSDNNNPIYYLRICYFVTFNTLIDLQSVSYTFSTATDKIANFNLGMDDCFIDCRVYIATQSFTTKANPTTIAMLSGFDVGSVGSPPNSNTYFGITLTPSQPTGTVSSFTMNATVYGSAEFTFLSYYFLSFDPSILNIVSYRQETDGTNSMGCFYTKNGCWGGSGSALSNSNFKTGQTGVMSYTENNFYIGISKMIMTWANGASTSAEFNLTNVAQISDTTISNTFSFTGNPNQQFNVAYSYFTLQTFACPTTGVDIYMVYNSNMCDNSCNSSIQQFANATNFCQPCGSLCWTCVTTATTCTSCYNTHNRVVSNSLCVCDTAGGFYDDGTSTVCPQCHYSCKTCTLGTTATCVTCNGADFRTLVGNSCPCNPGYFDNGAAACVACHYTCSSATCSSTANVGCTSCNLGKQRTQLANFTCGCVAGYYDNSTSSEQCSPCHYSCATCWGSNTLCLTCAATNLRSLTTTGNQCNCNAGYYDAGVALCSLCHVTCLTCSGPLATNCLSCDPSVGRTLSSSSCLCGIKLYDLNNVCVACAYSCLTCNAGTTSNCLTCNSAALRTFSTTTTSCPCNAGYYDAGTQFCVICDASCLTCTSSATMCTSCHNNPGRYFSGSGYSCLCSSGYVDITFNGFCTLCAYSCLTCSGSLATNCVLCPATRVLTGTSCLCPSGSYDNGINATCLPCASTCLTCNSGMTNACTSCSAAQYRFLMPSPVGTCLCSSAYYDSGSPVCQLCSPVCLTCWSAATNCSSCDSTINHRLITANNTCDCASGYVDVGAAICSSCVSTCLTCSVLPNNCTSCALDRTLTAGACLCIAGKFQNSATGACDACAPSCATCTGVSTYCITCPTGSFRSLVANACPCVTGYMETGSTFCQPCSYTCATCSGLATVCTSCPINSFRTLDSTLSTCPCNAGYYDNGGSVPCLTCSTTCVTCTLFSQCLSCSAALFRSLDTTALTCSCISGYFDNGVAACAICASTCLTCSVTASTCLTCPAGRALSGSSCLCVSGTYQTGGTCSPCSLACLTCTGTASTCTSCATGSFLSGGQCLCSTGFFLNGNICTACDSSCAACAVTAASCTACPSGQGTVLIGSSCSCPLGTFLNVSAAACQSCNLRCLTCSLLATSCLSCNAALFRTWDSSTLTCSCNSGYFDSGAALCQLCSPPCLACNGGTVLNCTSCIAGYTLIGSSCTIPPTCSAFQYQGTCVATCPNTTYVSGMSCLTCINNCLTCSTAVLCTSCLPGFLSFANACVGSCPTGTFANISSSSCMFCPSNCAQCSQYSGSIVCFTCLTGFSLLNNTCITCPSSTHVVLGENCVACLYPCLTCTDISTGSCLTCASTFKFYLGMCLGSCPQGFTSVSEICIPCGTNCVQCISDSCLTCATGFYLDPSGRCSKIGYFFDQTGITAQCHPNCLTCTNSSFSSCIACSQMRGNNMEIAINGYCDCWPNAVDVGNGTCDATAYKSVQRFTQVLVTSTTSAIFFSALGGVASLNFLACGSSLLYQQTYANFYFINSSAVLQTDFVLQRYGDSSISKLTQGNGRERFGRRLTTVNLGQQLQDNEALFLRGVPLSSLLDGCRIIGGLTASLWVFVLITKCVVAKLKKSGGSALSAAKKLHAFINESALIVLLIFTFNEVTLYGFASLKIALGGTYQLSIILTLSVIFIAYYVLYLLRLFVKAIGDPSPSTQTTFRALFVCFEPSRLKRKACRVYIPALLVRSLFVSLFLVIFSAKPVLQAMSCMGVVAIWNIYSFFACPYHFYIRVFLRLHELIFTIQIALLTVCVVRPEYSRVGPAFGILILNFSQILNFGVLSVCVFLDKVYSITCLKRASNSAVSNQVSQEKCIQGSSEKVQSQKDKEMMQEETINGFYDQHQNIGPQKKLNQQSDNSLFKVEKVESFDSLLMQQTNFSIPSHDVPISLNHIDIATSQEVPSKKNDEITKKRYRLKRERKN